MISWETYDKYLYVVSGIIIIPTATMAFFKVSLTPLVEIITFLLFFFSLAQITAHEYYHTKPYDGRRKNVILSVFSSFVVLMAYDLLLLVRSSEQLLFVTQDLFTHTLLGTSFLWFLVTYVLIED